MSAVIHYHDIGDYLSREEKLKIIDDFGDIAHIDWQLLTPDQHGDWLNKRDSEFDSYIPLAPEEKFDYLAKSWFTVNSSGLKTGMDAEAVNFAAESVVRAITKKTGNGDRNRLTEYAYRPFNKMWLYYDREVNQRQYRIPAIFPSDGQLLSLRGDGESRSFGESSKKSPHLQDSKTPSSESKKPSAPSALSASLREKKYPNKVICVTGAGGSKEFSCTITDCVPDLHFCGDVQGFPLYWYEKIERNDSVMELPGLEKQSGYIRHDAISDFILMEFRKIVGPRVQKEDIFHYVYGALHKPSYRAKFAADLKKQLPRLPLPKDRKEFEKVEKIGRELANLHLHYEEIDPWPLDEIGKCCQCGNVASTNSNSQLGNGNIGIGNTGNTGNIFHVTKMAWAKDGKDVRKDMLVVNENLTLAGIPAEAHQYVVNGRTPLEWLIDRYQIRTDSDSGIVNDPNKWGEEHDYSEYIVELVKRIVRLSVETVRLVGELKEKTKEEKTAEVVAAHPSATPPYWWKSGVWGVASPMPEGGNVVMSLKHKWYDKIEAGLKHDEFREKKPFWDKFLEGRKGKELRSVTFLRGQGSPVKMTWEVTGVDTAKNPGHAGFYVLHLGKRIK